MGRDYPPLEIEVWGDFACFTRPEMKVERVSYDVMTPSAARGILESILWKPQFRWRVREILVLPKKGNGSDQGGAFVRRMSIVRNEVKSTASERTTRGWLEPGHANFGEHFLADDDRTQRHALVLRDVRYVIRAEPVLCKGAGGNVVKYRDQFRRRVERGQCFWRPYLGCREFSAFFDVPSGDAPVAWTSDLGRMLFDLAYTGRGRRQGEAEPLFFPARVERGVMAVPDEGYERIEQIQRSQEEGEN